MYAKLKNRIEGGGEEGMKVKGEGKRLKGAFFPSLTIRSPFVGCYTRLRPNNKFKINIVYDNIFFHAKDESYKSDLIPD